MCKEDQFEKKLLDHVLAEFIGFLKKETKEIFSLSDNEPRLIYFEKLMHEELCKMINAQRNSSSYDYYILSCCSLNRQPSTLLKKVLTDSNIAPNGTMPSPRIKEQMKKNGKTIYPTISIVVQKKIASILYSLLADLEINKLVNVDQYFDTILKLFKENFNVSKNEIALRTIPKEDLIRELKLLILNSDTTVQKPRHLLDESIIDAYYI